MKPPRKAAGGAAARPFVPDEDSEELVAYGPVARRFHADDDSEDSEVAAITNEPISAAQTKKEKRRGPPLDSLSSLPPPGTKKAPQRVKPRPFLDTKRCTQPPGRGYRKRPPKPELVVEKVEALSGRVVYATDDESVGSKKGENSDDEDAKIDRVRWMTGSWPTTACVAEDPGFSAEARWATEGAGLLRELYAAEGHWATEDAAARAGEGRAGVPRVAGRRDDGGGRRTPPPPPPPPGGAGGGGGGGAARARRVKSGATQSAVTDDGDGPRRRPRFRRFAKVHVAALRAVPVALPPRLALGVLPLLPRTLFFVLLTLVVASRSRDQHRLRACVDIDP